MGGKVIISSSAVDLHGDRQSIDLLKKGVENINGSKKMRMLINHRRDLPPIGYWDNAELEQKKSVTLMKAEPIFYQKRELMVGNTSLIKESFEVPISFIERNHEANQPLTLTIDKNNFASWDIVDSLTQKLINDSNQSVQINYDTRKNFEPDPRLIITLTTYYSLIYPLVKPFIKKIGEKIAEDIADDIYKKSKEQIKGFFKTLKNYISSVRKTSIPKNKNLTTIFEVPGTPYIELHAKTDNADLIISSLSGNKISKLHQQIIELQNLLDIKEIYFKLNEKGQWKFTYLITDDGSVVGTKEIMAKRDHLHKRINLRSMKGFSIGADVKYSMEDDLENTTGN